MDRESAYHKAEQRAGGVQPPPIPGEADRRGAPPPIPGGAVRRVSPPKLAKGLPPRRIKQTYSILDPKDLDPFKNLLLFAELVVEGWLAGKHRSIDFGSRAEFAEHKPYVEGDSVADIDWRVYARNRHLVVRKHKEEKDMTSYLVVDVSGSMGYQGGGRESKQVRAARIAAALAYLMQRQGDKSALALFHETLRAFIKPGSTRMHLHELAACLEVAAGTPGGQTRAHGALDLCVPLFTKRGSIVVISDFFTDLDRFFDAIAQFQHRRFRVLLLHVIDPHELYLPDVAMARFVDMETSKWMQVAPDEIRDAYFKEMEAMTTRLEQESLRRGVEYRVLRTEEPYIEAIEAWMGLRGQPNSGRRQ